MKVIAFSLSLFHPSLRASKEVLNSDASHQLSFPNLSLGEEHVAHDFSQGTWRGFLVLMEYSGRMRTQIAFSRSGSYVCSRKSSDSRAMHGGNELLRPLTGYVSLSCGPMSLKTGLLASFLMLAVSFGVIFLGELLTEILIKIIFQDMVLVLPLSVYGEIVSIDFLRGPFG
jgi:hypothetical protein